MYIATSIQGISINFQCRSLKYTVGLFHKKCPDQYTDKCYKCKYCRAEMPAADATKLLNIYKEYKSTRNI